MRLAAAAAVDLFTKGRSVLSVGLVGGKQLEIKKEKNL